MKRMKSMKSTFGGSRVNTKLRQNVLWQLFSVGLLFKAGSVPWLGMGLVIFPFGLRLIIILIANSIRMMVVLVEGT